MDKQAIPGAAELDAVVPGVVELLAAGSTLVAAMNEDRPQIEVELSVRCMTAVCFNAAARSGWWTDLKTGHAIHGPIIPGVDHKTNIPAKLMLVVTEIIEGFTGAIDDINDDKLKHRKMLEVELADAAIRICDMAGALHIDLAPAFYTVAKAKLDWGDTLLLNLMLAIRDVCNAMESFRKGNRPDEAYPQFTGMAAHLSRALIRCLGIGAQMGYNVPAAMVEKLVFNAKRPDHKLENRAAEGGKSI